MPPPTANGLAGPRLGLRLNPRSLRLIPPLEAYPAWVAFTQTAAGKVLLFLAFGGLMKLTAVDLWMEMTIAAGLVSLAGEHRRYAAVLCTGIILILGPGWFPFRVVDASANQEGVLATLDVGHLRAATLLACAPLAAGSIVLARRFRDHPLARRPVLVSHALLAGLLALGASRVLHGLPQVILWSVTATFAGYFWFLAYALLDQRQRNPAPLLLQLATFHPFFGSLTAPVGKGAANWLRVEANTAEALAVTQLKGLKLLVWAVILAYVQAGYLELVHEELRVPTLASALDRFLTYDVTPSGHLGWLSIAAHFPELLLFVAVWGHVIVATGRLAGFRLLRNTWRPLSSRTIADFWNRFYYYFKEVLVHVYFYPTYLRCFKRHPRLRLAFATFMAAGVGNFFFHLILNNDRILQFGLLDALVRMQTYAFYCLLLVIGIVASQLRTRRPGANAGWWRGRARPMIGVAGFYCLLSFFDVPGYRLPLTTHFEFLYRVLLEAVR